MLFTVSKPAQLCYAVVMRIGKELKAYKRLAFFASAALLLLPRWTWAGSAAQGEPLARSALAQVETLAGITKTLDQLGKETMTQAATVLDLGEAAAPELLVWFKDRNKDWRVRYWAADMLGYVGRNNDADALLRCALNTLEKKPLRLRSAESVGEIFMRRPMTSAQRKTLSKAARAEKDRAVREKLFLALKGPGR